MSKIDLYNGDCLEILKQIEDNSIDLILTDPPYAINYQTFRTKSAKLKNDDNTEWVESFAKESSRVLKQGNHMYCFVDAEMSAYFIIALKENGFKIRNLLTIPRGIKGNGGNRIFQQQFEFCIFATLGPKNIGRNFNETKILKPSETYLKDKRYSAKEWLYRLPDNWYWTKASVHNAKKKYHPTEKNIECLKYMLELSSNEGELVLDPFMGSGSTGVACLNLNRDFIGMEINKTYFDIADKRIKEKENEIQV